MRIFDPMAYNSDILFGRITKIHGNDGSVTVRLEKTFIENIPEIRSVFLEIEGRPVPFFISHSEYNGAEIIKIKFEDYDSYEKISEFQGCRVFLTTGKNIERLSPEIREIEGYKVFMQDNIMIGVVKEVIRNPGQLLLNVISVTNKEILIPLHQDFIVNLDTRKRSIKMNLPEGLTDANT